MILSRIAPSKIDRKASMSLLKARSAASELSWEWGDYIDRCNQGVSPGMLKGYTLSRKITDYIELVNQKQLMLIRVRLLVEALRLTCESAAIVDDAKKKRLLDPDKGKVLERPLDTTVTEIGRSISRL